MTSNHSVVNLEKNNNIVNKITTLYYKTLEIIVHYTILTGYYILEDTSRWQVFKA